MRDTRSAVERAVPKEVTRVHKGTQKVGDVAVSTSIEVETSECAKLLAVAGDSQKIGAFLDWLMNERDPPLAICALTEEGREVGQYYPAPVRIQGLLAEYFDIDEDQCERERQALLEAIRR